MNIVELALPTINKFASAYLSEEESLHRFFTYNPFSADTFENRKNSLAQQTFLRDDLADHLLSFNARYHADEKTLHNIERFRSEESLVVIGGQQAGLLTGPVYTISKIISIIKLAKEQENRLGVPVLPVFWIAGEDHDYHEINHVNIPRENGVEKISLPMKAAGKKMVSELQLDKQQLSEWMLKIVNSYGETAFTNDIKALLERSLESADNLVDFFAELITTLFKGTGLILVDASNPDLRKIEVPFFQRLLTSHKRITSEVLAAQDDLEKAGFGNMLDVQGNSMNIFFHKQGERELLFWDEELQKACTKDGKTEFSWEQLMEEMKSNPHLFSNNVVTRPLMQEFLFPALAFIGGPGEISYWAELKGAFEALDLEMPPVVPRIGLTIVERHIESTVKELGESVEDILINGLDEKRKAWLRSQELEELESRLDSYQKEYEKVHKQFRKVGKDVLPHLEPVFEKNWTLIDRQFAFMKRLMERSSYEKHETVMKKYHRAELSLIPDSLPQERVWNIYYYLNQYGLDLVQRIVELPLEHNGKHKLIYV
ncbi:bacillithiol biosynthesis cysteine-adding enzyme BshC [Bacillus tianshenii]|uniref:bacillithiol biosynthesis cysteine-adding enzyme BshC n=1 Tax=Sutcliffiella tianshenii TaxID=1463404 RepID=UPI001CD80AF6|nr:bacillithiol biosynthesis cysteine-adding enzyme BshC [Bacillus tianshenii]MCA1321298.1 bacillithiol biosynthesis cysteine-adding enzyme BshC [Bacillus tianshenii]